MNAQQVPTEALLQHLPPSVLQALVKAQQCLEGEVYLVGGTVRDLILGRIPNDFDFTVAGQARLWAEAVQQATGASWVELGKEEATFRLVLAQGTVLDFSSFRQGAQSITEDLQRRDLSINALALPLTALLQQHSLTTLPLIDPLGGRQDLRLGRIRLASNTCLREDPLRMLRVFRFAAALDFTVEAETLQQVQIQASRIRQVAPERVAYELDAILKTNRAHPAFVALRDCGLLWELLPELRAGVGMAQPASHHLDVFDHCLEALGQIETILAALPYYFPSKVAAMQHYGAEAKRRVQVKWAALLHDVGKPACFAIKEDAQGQRITFYQHDLRGAALFRKFSQGLRRSREDTEATALLIRQHMRPFFLANLQRQGDLTLRACLRLLRELGPQLPGLFLLAMADALAGKGENSPEAMEQELAGLFAHLLQLEQDYLVPVHNAPPLLTGDDLIQELGLKPGPLFRVILEAVEEAALERSISSRAEALALARSVLANP